MRAPDAREQLLAFEIGGVLYALPVGGVVEVADAGPIGCIPTVSPSVAGVWNHHGNALPVVERSELLGLAGDGCPPSGGQVLVIGDRRGGVARLGLAVDRVLGLAQGAASAGVRAAEPPDEQWTFDGRVANVLDPRRLVARAQELIEQSVGRVAP